MDLKRQEALFEIGQRRKVIRGENLSLNDREIDLHLIEGAWVYLAAWDVHRAKVLGRCESENGIAPVDRWRKYSCSTLVGRFGAGGNVVVCCGAPECWSLRRPR